MGRSRQPSVFIRVDLPEPDGPISATYSPRSIDDRHAAKRVDLDLVEHVDLSDVGQFDEGHRDGLGVRVQGLGIQTGFQPSSDSSIGFD